MRERDHEHDGPEVGCQHADLLPEDRLDQQRGQHRARARGEHSDKEPRRSEDPPHRHAEQHDGRETEVDEVVDDAAPNHLHDVRRPGNADSKVLAFELLSDPFDTLDEAFRVVPRSQNDDIARSMILGDEQSAPEWALLSILIVLRAIRETAHAGNGWN